MGIVIAVIVTALVALGYLGHTPTTHPVEVPDVVARAEYEFDDVQWLVRHEGNGVTLHVAESWEEAETTRYELLRDRGIRSYLELV